MNGKTARKVEWCKRLCCSTWIICGIWRRYRSCSPERSRHLRAGAISKEDVMYIPCNPNAKIMQVPASWAVSSSCNLWLLSYLTKNSVTSRINAWHQAGRSISKSRNRSLDFQTASGKMSFLSYEFFPVIFVKKSTYFFMVLAGIPKGKIENK